LACLIRGGVPPSPHQSLERRPGLRRPLRHQGLHLLQPAAHPAGERGPIGSPAWMSPGAPSVVSVTGGVGGGRSKTKTIMCSRPKGSHLEHNFGHGKQYLSAFMLSLNLLALLCHTVLEWSDDKYAVLRVCPTFYTRSIPVI
jgi:hypothetical protein